MMNATAKALAAALAGETPDQQRHREFITELCNNVRDAMLKQVPLLPEEWDGLELRTLIHKRFASPFMGSMSDKRSRRYKAFENHCLTHNLY